MLAAPEPAISPEETVAVNWVALTNDVGSGEAFHSTTVADRKPVPVTVRVNPALVATADAGVMLTRAGVGALTGNVSVFEIVPPEFTPMVTSPGFEISVAATGAVSWVALTTLVVRAVPFHWMVAPVRKPVPLTVRVNAAP